MSATTPYPAYSRAERIADACVHIVGISAALVALTAFALTHARHLGWTVLIATGIYAVGLLVMLSASAAYHMAAHTPYRPILRRLDHAAIYIKIAASLTPLAVLLGTATGYAVLVMTWILALCGAHSKLRAERGNMSTAWLPYLALAWLGSMVIMPLGYVIPPETFYMILGGGAIYCAALIFYCWHHWPFANALWHSGIVLASATLYLGIAGAVAST